MLPIVKVLLFWIACILLIANVDFNYEPTLSIVLVVFIGFVLAYYLKPIACKYVQNLLLVVLVVCTVKLFNTHFNRLELNSLCNQRQLVLLEVVERYKTTDYYHKYIVELKAVHTDSILNVSQKCLLLQNIDSSSTRFYTGDEFWCEAYVTQIKSAKHPALFDASKYWNNKGVLYNLWLKNNSVKKIETKLTWFEIIRKKQEECIELIHKQELNLSTKQIVAALVLGDKRGVSKEISKSFSELGVIHVLALSGLHVGIIYVILAFVLNRIFRKYPIFQSFILVMIIILYAILTGLSPSVTRASLMFLLYALSLAINRRVSSFNVVFLSAFILLLYDSNLLFDIGFQLSYLAVLGILYFYNFFQRFIVRQNYFLRLLFSLVVVSLAAQFSVGLLSVYYFNSFPVSFLWANIIVLPYITVLLYVSLLYVLMMSFGVHSYLIDSLMNMFVDGLLKIMSFLGRYSFDSVEVYLSNNQLFYLYGLLLMLCWVFFEKQYKSLRVLYLYILLGVLSHFFHSDNKKKQLFVNASKQGFVISILANKEQVVITDNKRSISYLMGDYSIRNSVKCSDIILDGDVIQNGFCSINKNLIQYFDQSLLVINSEHIDTTKEMRVDVLLMRNYRCDINQISQVFFPKKVLLDTRMSSKQKQNLIERWNALGVQPIDLSEHVYVAEY